MSDDYTPSTDEVREAWNDFKTARDAFPSEESWEAHDAEFDRWLESVGAATRTRFVSTVDELDALPIGSVVLDRLLMPWHKRPGTRWYATGWDGGVRSPAVPLPARVLYEAPGEAMSTTSRVEYDIAFGDETDDNWTTDLNHVERELAYINARIAEGDPGYTEDEYQRPIRIVKRM